MTTDLTLLPSAPNSITSCQNGPEELCWTAALMGNNTKYNLYVAVVMPDHVHLILAPLTDVERQMISPLSEIMKGIKGTAAHAINRQLDRRGSVWLEESFDHVVRSSESLDAKIEYVLKNPVHKGLVTVPSEYQWTWRRPTAPVFPDRNLNM